MTTKDFWNKVADSWVKEDNAVIPNIELTDTAEEIEEFLDDNDMDILSDLDDLMSDLSFGD